MIQPAKSTLEKIKDVARNKARSIMLTTVSLLGLLQIISGTIMDLIFYGLAVAVVLFFSKFSNR